MEKRSNYSTTTDNEKFSFRWGIDLLDDGYTTFPNHFWRVYIQVITRAEWLFICHLATYKYEKAGSECRPGLPSIARQMGYSLRMVQNLRRSLEEKGFLTVVPRQGLPSLYDFSKLSKKLDELDVQPSSPMQSSSPMKPSSPMQPSTEPMQPSTEPMQPSTEPANPVSSEEEIKKNTDEKVQNRVAAALPDQDLWLRFVEESKLQMTKATFDTWIKPCALQTLDAPGGKITVGVKNDYAKDWLENRLDPVIRRTLHGILAAHGWKGSKDELEVTYQIIPEQPPQPTPARAAPARRSTARPAKASRKARPKQPTSRPPKPKPTPASQPAQPAAAPATQPAVPAMVTAGDAQKGPFGDNTF